MFTESTKAWRSHTTQNEHNHVGICALLNAVFVMVFRVGVRCVNAIFPR